VESARTASLLQVHQELEESAAMSGACIVGALAATD